MKFLKRIAICLLIIILLSVGIIIFIGKSSFSFSNDAQIIPTDLDLTNVIKEANINYDTRIVDIAMLGSHDSFSDQISKNSLIDPYEADNSILRNNIVKSLANGLFVRLAKAQNASANVQLAKGVRYFDIRLSLLDDGWYTKHGLLSGKFNKYLDEIISFLINHPTEFLILDFQHVDCNNDYDKLFELLQNGTTSLSSFVNYDPTVISLNDLTYGDVTAMGSKAGVVILTKAEVTDQNNFHYPYNTSIRSIWHNENDSAVMIEKINNEYQTLMNNQDLDRDKLRVNQAQKTGLFSTKYIWKTLMGWSLLDMARKFNNELILNDNINNWLSVLPIFMVDNATSDDNDFNYKINKLIIEYNRK